MEATPCVHMVQGYNGRMHGRSGRSLLRDRNESSEDHGEAWLWECTVVLSFQFFPGTSPFFVFSPRTSPSFVLEWICKENGPSLPLNHRTNHLWLALFSFVIFLVWQLPCGENNVQSLHFVCFYFSKSSLHAPRLPLVIRPLTFLFPSAWSHRDISQAHGYLGSPRPTLFLFDLFCSTSFARHRLLHIVRSRLLHIVRSRLLHIFCSTLFAWRPFLNIIFLTSIVSLPSFLRSHSPTTCSLVT